MQPGAFGGNCKLDQQQQNTLLALAESDMNVTAVAKKMYLNRNTVVYRLDRIKAKTGLDPRRFYDLVKLLELLGGAE